MGWLVRRDIARGRAATAGGASETRPASGRDSDRLRFFGGRGEKGGDAMHRPCACRRALSPRSGRPGQARGLPAPERYSPAPNSLHGWFILGLAIRPSFD